MTSLPAYIWFLIGLVTPACVLVILAGGALLFCWLMGLQLTMQLRRKPEEEAQG
ncbi:MAG: hypothetical protein V1929_00235 [bacterium]